MMKRFLQVFLLLAGGLFVGILMVEGTVRLFPDLLPQTTQDSVHLVGRKGIGAFARAQASCIDGDPITGIHVRPNCDVWLTGHPDFSFRIKTTPLPDGSGVGIRDWAPKERPFAVAVGDSFTFGNGVDIDDAWVKVLERRIGLAVVNLGIPAACSTQYSRMLAQHGKPLAPKVILWEAFMPDIVENVWFDSWLAHGGGSFYHWDAWRDYVNLSQAGYAHQLVYWLTTRSAVMNMMKNKIRGWGHTYRTESADMAFAGPYRFDMRDPLERKGWVLMQKAIRDAQRTAASIGATLVVVYFPTKEETYAQLLTQLSRVKPIGLGEPAGMLATLTRREHIHFLNLAPGLQARAAAGEQLYFRYDGHWNKTGNHRVAELIADYLRKEKLLPSASYEVKKHTGTNRLRA